MPTITRPEGRLCLHGILLVSATALPQMAMAQADPGSIDRTIPEISIPTEDTRVAIEAPELASQPSELKLTSRFVLGAVNISGATAFDSMVLSATFEPMLATSVSQADLEVIAMRLTELYRSSGYVLSYARVPEQSVQSGIVEVEVVEGYIDDVSIEGEASQREAVSDIARRLTTDRPIKQATLERMLGLIRDIPGVVVSDVQISRSPNDRARHQLKITLGAERARGLVYADNRGSISGARARAFTSYGVNSVLTPGDQFQFDLFAIPSDEFRLLYGQAKATFPLGHDGIRLNFSGAHSWQKQQLSGPDQKGVSRQFFAGLSYPLKRSRALSLIGHATFGEWFSRERRAGATVQRDRLQTARIAIEFKGQGQPFFSGQAGIVRGLDLFDASNRGDPLTSRTDGSHEFLKLHADAQLTFLFDDSWIGRVELSGQVSTAPVLAVEEFAVGGSRIGRAFDFNEVAGDSGFAGLFEVTRRFGKQSDAISNVELFSFIDAGWVSRQRSTPAFPGDQWLAGAGAGIRLSFRKFVLAAEVGVPIARSDEKKPVRAFFSIIRSF